MNDEPAKAGTRLRAGLLVAVGSLAAVMVLAEVALRLVRPIRLSEEVEYISDGHLGARLAPGKTYALKGGGRCSINAQGFRGTRDTPPAGPAGTIRIVALGGSSTICFDSDDARTWCALLERMLREHYRRDVEVVNAGVPGYSVFESKINYQYRLRHLHPDMIVVYHTWNDIKYFKSIEAGWFPDKQPWRPTWRRQLKSLARRFQLGRRVRLFLNEVVYPRRRENMFAQADPATAIASDGAAHRWERQNYRDLVALATVDGVPIVLATQASLVADSTIQKPDVRGVLYVEYANMSFDELAREWDAVTAIIRDTAAETGACLADVRSRVPADREHLADHVHPTDRGNEAVARALFDDMTACAQVDSVLRGPGDR